MRSAYVVCIIACYIFRFVKLLLNWLETALAFESQRFPNLHLQPWKLLQNADVVDVDALKAIFQDEQLDCFHQSEYTIDIDELNAIEAATGACATESRPRKSARRTEDAATCWARVPRRCRDMMKEALATRRQYFLDLDQTLFLVASGVLSTAEFHSQSSFVRVAVHGLVAYYDLHLTQSVDRADMVFERKSADGSAPAAAWMPTVAFCEIARSD